MSEAPAILYIDDDDGLRRLAQRGLIRRGYRVDTAASGREGVEKARAGGYDVIAVDHYMPGEDGLATLARLQDIPDVPPVIYVTGSEESRIAVAAMKAGAADYVVKTADEDFFELLSASIGQALKQVELEREKRAAEDALRTSNLRLEALLREVNHRVSNSLQLVSAFVHMQARTLTNEAAKTALLDTERRITAIKQVHRRLYTSDDVESVDMADYLAALIAELEETWSTPDAKRTLTLAAEPVRLATDKAISLGVIVNELVSNACKYAYAKDCAGEVRVALRREGDGRFTLEVEDDGCGMEEGTTKGTGLGTRLINAMAQTLQSSVTYLSTGAGVRATLTAAV